MPSLGAGGSLVVATLCCLLLAIALLTFRDWPVRGDASPGEAITMTPPAAKAAGRAASGPAAPVAAAVAMAAPAARERVAGSSPARRQAARTPQAPARATPPASTQPTPGAGSAPAASSPATDSPQQDTGRDGGLPLPELPSVPQPAPGAGTIESVVETVEKPLPPAVKEPIQPVLDTVHQVGGTVDGVTGPLP